MTTSKRNKTDEEKLAFFEDMGKTELPSGYRSQILTILQRWPKRWYSPQMMSDGLEMSMSYAYKILEHLAFTKLIIKTIEGDTAYYMWNKDGPHKKVEDETTSS